MAARSRTRAAWINKDKSATAGLREIDKYASMIDGKMEEGEKGIARTIIMGAGIAKQDIAEINEDVDDTCTYCNVAKSTATHTLYGSAPISSVSVKILIQF